MQVIALIELGLTLLPKITVGVVQFVAWLNTLRAAAKQAEVWTPEYEAAWRSGLLSHELKPEEIPDAA
jgi:hypothetical protein